MKKRDAGWTRVEESEEASLPQRGRIVWIGYETRDDCSMKLGYRTLDGWRELPSFYSFALNSKGRIRQRRVAAPRWWRHISEPPWFPSEITD